MATANQSEMDLLKNRCSDQLDLLVALKQILDTVPLHHPPVSNDSQAKQPSTITGTTISSGSTTYFCPSNITEKHIAQTRRDLLGEQGSDEKFRDIVES